MKILLNNCSLGNYQNVNILIEDNVFTQISREIIRVETDLTFDLTGKIVLPGIIDLSQNLFDNLNDPEKIREEAKALTKGGITSLINIHTGNSPVGFYAIDSLNQSLLANIGESSVIDFFTHFDDRNGFIFNILNIGDVEDNYDVEDPAFIKWFYKRILELQKQSKILFVSMKDPGLSLFLKYVPKNDYRICFYNFSKPSEVARIVNFKKKGFNFSIVFDVNLFFLYKELIKNAVDQKRLSNPSGYSSVRDINFFKECLKRGFIDIVYSNHAPNMLWEKYELNKIGIPSAETLLPLMLDLASTTNSGIQMVWKVLCDNPSNIFQLDGRGKIEVGYFADLIVVDPDKFWYISNADIYSTAKWTPYAGKRLWGMPIMSIVNGNITYNLYDGVHFSEDEYVSNYIYSK
ncbi:MAG: hypothetical protein ACRCVI_00640 [Mycoplasmoidaceae bacterium]